MKNVTIVLCAMLCAASANAADPTPREYGSYSDTMTILEATFKGVLSVGGSDCTLFFKDVVIRGRLEERISTDMDNVSVMLVPGKKAYTTLNIYDAYRDVYDWVKAAKIVIVVRTREDQKLWTDYLVKIRKERDDWRKYNLEPTRVLPPVNP